MEVSTPFSVVPELQHASGLRTVGGLSLTDCLQVHVFELPKYVILSDKEPIADPVFEEATGVLEMIAKNPEERQHYEDRLKAERDEWARTAQAKLEGIEEGQRNERARTVKMLRDIVGELAPSDEKLADLSLDELAAIETELQRRLRDRTG